MGCRVFFVFANHFKFEFVGHCFGHSQLHIYILYLQFAFYVICKCIQIHISAASFWLDLASGLLARAQVPSQVCRLHLACNSLTLL